MYELTPAITRRQRKQARKEWLWIFITFLVMLAVILDNHTFQPSEQPSQVKVTEMKVTCKQEPSIRFDWQQLDCSLLITEE